MGCGRGLGMTGDGIRLTIDALAGAGSILAAAVGRCPDPYRDELAELAWRVGYLAAKIDPYTGDETETETLHPFGAATERGN